MRVLLVEDEEKQARSIKKVLMSQGYAVDVAATGQAGYDLALDESYDLILLDIGLPDLNGVEVSKKLRREHVQVPILMLTARDATADKVSGLDSGADDYLVKPFAIEELLARMRSLLRRGGSEPVMILQVDSLSLDPTKRIVERSGVEVPVSAKEYALLEFMMRHPNHVLSKQQILDHVWDGEMDPFSNVVDVYIGYIRQKIDRQFPDEKPLIRTVKGLGYRLGIGVG